MVPVSRHFLTTPFLHQGSGGGAGVRLRQARHLGACLRNQLYDQHFLNLGGCSGLGVSPAAPTGRARCGSVMSQTTSCGFLKGMGQAPGMGAINMGGASLICLTFRVSG